MSREDGGGVYTRASASPAQMRRGTTRAHAAASAHATASHATASHAAAAHLTTTDGRSAAGAARAGARTPVSCPELAPGSFPAYGDEVFNTTAALTADACPEWCQTAIENDCAVIAALRAPSGAAAFCAFDDVAGCSVIYGPHTQLGWKSLSQTRYAAASFHLTQA